MDLRRRSIEIIKQYQSTNGAYVACPHFPTYHYCWLRDGAFIAYGMDVAGEHESAARFYQWVHQTLLKHKDKALLALAKKEQGLPVASQDLLHTRYTLDGEEGQEDWPNFQLDGYGTWLWGLSEHIRRTDAEHLIDLYRESIELTLSYIQTFWQEPNYDCWEEFGDQIHPATLACLYGGITGVNCYLQQVELTHLAERIKQYILKECVAEERIMKFIGNPNVDASLLWISIPFGVIEPDHPIMQNTVQRMEETIVVEGGVHRYPQDTYYGGGLWILLSAWLGWYYASIGKLDKAKHHLQWVDGQQTETGELPEQVSSHLNDPSYYDGWVERWGEIATPLLWSHAMYLVLEDAVRKEEGNV